MTCYLPTTYARWCSVTRQYARLATGLYGLSNPAVIRKIMEEALAQYCMDRAGCGDAIPCLDSFLTVRLKGSPVALALHCRSDPCFDPPDDPFSTTPESTYNGCKLCCMQLEIQTPRGSPCHPTHPSVRTSRPSLGHLSTHRIAG